jgi:hypothetical protein
LSSVNPPYDFRNLPVPIETHLKRLSVIYGSMDQAYRETAAFYDFGCRGCRENCCTTYFFHHTIIESLYLVQGFCGLDKGMKEEIMERAVNRSDPLKRESYMCPVNEGGRCLLYPYRTMICRLHGLPYEVQKPGGQKDEGPGCAKFEAERRRKGLPHRRIDRTPFYTDLANLERDLRMEIGFFQKFKKTIVEMIRVGGKEENLPGMLERLAQ